MASLELALTGRLSCSAPMFPCKDRSLECITMKDFKVRGLAWLGLAWAGSIFLGQQVLYGIHAQDRFVLDDEHYWLH
ncbi:hypothetical protein FP2506_16824 [Fulvimarina pelagi HTCC2506]|uniref:Uncharacterized protein n=1 Tax=Fulvimarina pelagi HTCC2506 TaxID=314231 RepID=Q0G2R5_9HYPH|nr:hypothetical protein FP2506_16824 [Fulvimarina pelagi HTCC2506]